MPSTWHGGGVCNGGNGGNTVTVYVVTMQDEFRESPPTAAVFASKLKACEYAARQEWRLGMVCRVSSALVRGQRRKHRGAEATDA